MIDCRTKPELKENFPGSAKILYFSNGSNFVFTIAVVDNELRAVSNNKQPLLFSIIAEQIFTKIAGK